MILMLSQPSGEPTQCLESSLNEDSKCVCDCALGFKVYLQLCCLTTALPHPLIDQPLWLPNYHWWQSSLLTLVATVTDLCFLC